MVFLLYFYRLGRVGYDECVKKLKNRLALGEPVFVLVGSPGKYLKAFKYFPGSSESGNCFLSKKMSVVLYYRR